MDKKKTKRPSPKKKTTTPATKLPVVARSNKLVKKMQVKKAQVVRKKNVSLVPSDPILQAYLREVQKYPLLTKEEEHDLAVQFYETKDKGALQKLITGNLRFVVKIAYEYVHYRSKLMDLIQEGNMGLLKAVQEFDPYKEVRLTTYAVWWIRSYIQDSILKNYSLVKLGTTQAQKRLFYRLRSEQKKLEQEGISPQQNIKLLAARLDVREKDIEEMNQRLGSPELSLNAPISDSEKREHIQQLSDNSVAVDDQLAESEQSAIFKKILGEFSKTLDAREKVIFADRMIAENPMTLQEIGDKYNVTKERARQIEEQIKNKLKTYVEQHFPDYGILTESMQSRNVD